MERSPQNNEQNEQPKQVLPFDAVGETGNIFSIIGNARGLLDEEQRQKLMEAIDEATAPGARKGYEDILGIVNEHVRLVDISGTYPQYGLVDEQGGASGTPTPEQ